MASEAPILLIAYDATDPSRAAIDVAARLFPGASATIVHAYGPGAPLAMPAVPAFGPAMLEDEAMDDLVHATQREGHRVADEGARYATQLGLRAVARAVAGDGTAGSWSAIVETAQALNVDLVVIGTRANTGLKAALLGSVSTGVVRHIDLPVLVVPKHANSASQQTGSSRSSDL